MKTKFITEEVQKRICLTFDMDQANYLVLRCPFEKIEKVTKIPGVSDVEYDGHFGPHIWLTIDSEHYEESLPKVEAFFKKLLRNVRR